MPNGRVPTPSRADTGSSRRVDATSTTDPLTSPVSQPPDLPSRTPAQQDISREFRGNMLPVVGRRQIPWQNGPHDRYRGAIGGAAPRRPQACL
ncbi:hypothetical protein ABEU20_000564 [Rhodococcus sp. PAM 2766]|uniref:Uncharacterized protein n=1 Tax=Rhodococcus parequi TaxID=3137122 RepID=A0ABW9F9Q6_9NOCA